MYKLLNNFSGTPTAVLRSDGWSIPFDPANTDYQAYLAWLEAGNQPEPAEAPAVEPPAETPVAEPPADEVLE
jgi:hypothetical protein